MQRRPWFQDWLKGVVQDPEVDLENIEEDFEEVEAEMDLAMDPDKEVLNTGYTLHELDREIENRSKINRQLSRQIKRHKNRYESYRDDAVEATGDEKTNLYVKAKEEQIKHDTKQEFLDELSDRKLFLQSLRLQHISKQLENPAANIQGVEIDVGNLPVDEIADAIHEGEGTSDETRFVMDEIERELDLGAGLDISDIKEDVEQAEAARIDEGTSDLEEDVQSEIDQEIEEKLQELDEEFQE